MTFIVHLRPLKSSGAQKNWFPVSNLTPVYLFLTYSFPIPDASGTMYYCDTQVPQSAVDAQTAAPSWLYLQ